jgi:hypothetical protein
MNDNSKLNKKAQIAQVNLMKAFESIIPKKSQGGQLLSAGLSMVPGYGAVLGPAAGMVDNLIDQSKMQVQPQIATNIDNNIFGNLAMGGKLKKYKKGGYINSNEMKEGGFINQDFKQFDTGSHDSGNDMNVDQNGNVSNNPVAAVQNKENTYRVGTNNYVMSDTLVNPMTGNTFNVDAAKVNKQHTKADFLPEEKNSLNFKMKSLSMLNDAMRNTSENFQKANGGSIPFTSGTNNYAALAYPMVTGNAFPNYSQRFPMGVDGKSIMPPATFNNQQSTNTPHNGMVPTGDTNPLDPQVVERNDLPQDPTTFGTSINNLKSNPNQSFVNPAQTNPLDITASRNMPAFDEYSVQPKTGNNTNYNNVAIGLKGAALLKSTFDALSPAEKEDPILPNYSKSDDYFQKANIDYTQAKQDATGASNIGRNVNRSSSSGFAQFQGREANRSANLGDALSRISESQNNQQSQLNVNKAQYEQGKAVDTANRLSQNRINNQQNRATAKLAGEKLFSELSGIGTEFNKYQNHLDEIKNNKEIANYYIKEGTMLLNTQLDNFKLDPEFVTKLKSGASIDELINFHPADFQKLTVAVDKNKTKKP